MSRWLALIGNSEEKSNHAPDTLTKGDKTQPEDEGGGFCQVLSGCQVGVEEKIPRGADGPRDGAVAAEARETADNQVHRISPSPQDFRHGQTFDGTPKTWTGKVVSLDAWRQLSEWEKHGPDGRMWNGITRRWELPE